VLIKYTLVSEIPQRIPVFPLRGALLLPRATLPLNIFEPRYLAMIDEVMTGHRILGIVQPAGGDDSESPQGNDYGVRAVGCAGRLTAYQELDDGRLMITLTGVCRFRIASEAEGPAPYRCFNVNYQEFAQDLDAGAGEDTVDRDVLHRVLKAYLESNRLSADWQAIADAPTELLVNALSVISPFAAEEKQALLEAPTLKDRADVLVALTQMELASNDDNSGGTLQ